MRPTSAWPGRLSWSGSSCSRASSPACCCSTSRSPKRDAWLREQMRAGLKRAIPAAAAHRCFRCGHEAGRPFRPTRSVGPVRFRQSPSIFAKEGQWRNGWADAALSYETGHRDAPIAEDDGGTTMWRSSRLIGYGMRATDGSIGQINDFLFDDEAWTSAGRSSTPGPGCRAARSCITSGRARATGRDAAGNPSRPDARADRGQPVTKASRPLIRSMKGTGPGGPEGSPIRRSWLTRSKNFSRSRSTTQSCPSGVRRHDKLTP